MADEREVSHSNDGDAQQTTDLVTGLSRRGILASGGALTLGSLLGVDAAGATSGKEKEDGRESAPETMTGFEEAVAETTERGRHVVEEGPYEPTWASLGDVDPTPEWFRDGKFGIFCHWGPYSVPAYGHEWYPRQMYNDGHWIHDHHVDTYERPDAYPYQKFVPEFTAENFDADEWADLFERAGACFAGPAAEHHDGWSLWDSKVTPWNAGDRGPKRDLVGELSSAIRDKGLRFLTTFHHSYNLRGEEGYFSTAYENYPSVMEEYPDRVMYGNLPEELRHETWFAKLVEAVGQYDPDLVWFDWGLHWMPEAYRKRFLAFHYNRAAAEDRDVVVTNKDDSLPLDASVEDFEMGRPKTAQEQAWTAELPVAETGGWGYVEGRTFYSAEFILHTLIDIVSKNGQLLLSIGPRPDGTIEEAERERLLSVGEWLETNGDAIYGTRPWEAFGEGPTRLEEGGDFVSDIVYTADDVRYTCDPDTNSVYAIVMGWPGAGTLTLAGTAVENASGASSTQSEDEDSSGKPKEGEVTLLGYGRVSHSVDDDGHLTIDVPGLSTGERPSNIAVTFELSGFDLSPTDAAHR
ncbi:alpha-L-fucosidase [Halopelagius longus]|uniref:alpha-L-fucosidase n=1 Tax=Halopelagius longus TaxID=1236180 RepID=A0A1H1FBN1_9EURY|nr:alpha-L-fucosidase [Halopelagius longus]RDI70172.1 alpha-L-fucosidase [Halopelagius longus]SDQ98513.1 alpha-L-fucosidase [Halopelagius longus]